MKRTKMNIIIAVFIAVACITSLAMETNSALLSEKTLYNQVFFDMIDGLRPKREAGFIPGSDADSTLEEMCSMHEYGSCPYVIGVYNSKGELVASTQTYVKIITNDDEKIIINIDKYISESTKEQIKDFAHNYLTNIDVVKIDYAEVDGSYIPVNLYIQYNGVYNKMRKFVITDYEISGSFYNDVHMRLSKKEKVNSREAFIECVFYNYFENGANERICNDLQQRLTSDKVMKYVNELVTSDEPCDYGELGESNSCWFTEGYWYCRGEKYIIHFEAEVNYFNEALQNSNYIYRVKLISAVFFAMSVIVIAVFNVYYSKRKRLEDARNAFVSAAAHELKTPIAAIQNNCECIIENIAPEKNGKYLATIHSESERMSTLVSTLLQYNRLETNVIEKSKCSLTDIVNKEIEVYLDISGNKGVILEKNVMENAYIVANESLISLVVDNFLSNAVKHTEENKKISVTLSKHKSKYRLSVFNEGEHINKEASKNLWDVFYRADKARNSSDKSSGMGLAVCKRILDHHKAKYGFYNKPTGVEFYFIIK